MLLSGRGICVCARRGPRRGHAFVFELLGVALAIVMTTTRGSTRACNMLSSNRVYVECRPQSRSARRKRQEREQEKRLRMCIFVSLHSLVVNQRRKEIVNERCFVVRHTLAEHSPVDSSCHFVLCRPPSCHREGAAVLIVRVHPRAYALAVVGPCCPRPHLHLCQRQIRLSLPLRRNGRAAGPVGAVL